MVCEKQSACTWVSLACRPYASSWLNCWITRLMKPVLAGPPTYDLKSDKRDRRERKPGRNHSGEERRKEERRKSDHPVLLDTRSTRRRRALLLGNTINLKI